MIQSSGSMAPFFALFDWRQVPERDETKPWPGIQPHPEKAYIKALLVKKHEKFEYVTELRNYLVSITSQLRLNRSTPKPKPWGLGTLKSATFILLPNVQLFFHEIGSLLGIIQVNHGFMSIHPRLTGPKLAILRQNA